MTEKAEVASRDHLSEREETLVGKGHMEGAEEQRTQEKNKREGRFLTEEESM